MLLLLICWMFWAKVVFSDKSSNSSSTNNPFFYSSFSSSSNHSNQSSIGTSTPYNRAAVMCSPFTPLSTPLTLNIQQTKTLSVFYNERVPSEETHARREGGRKEREEISPKCLRGERREEWRILMGGGVRIGRNEEEERKFEN